MPSQDPEVRRPPKWLRAGVARLFPISRDILPPRPPSPVMHVGAAAAEEAMLWGGSLSPFFFGFFCVRVVCSVGLFFLGGGGASIEGASVASRGAEG